MLCVHALKDLSPKKKIILKQKLIGRLHAHSIANKL
jgi:hypothetical protein